MSAENEPAADPGQFLREVANADEGWSERYGGPEGIARWTLNLQDALKEQASDLAAVRTAAIRGVRRSAVYHASRRWSVASDVLYRASPARKSYSAKPRSA